MGKGIANTLAPNARRTEVYNTTSSWVRDTVHKTPAPPHARYVTNYIDNGHQVDIWMLDMPVGDTVVYLEWPTRPHDHRGVYNLASWYSSPQTAKLDLEALVQSESGDSGEGPAPTANLRR